MLERVPNITMDRVNVGGNQSGQQSGYISRGANTGNNKWSLDGVDITDMSATGASPIYYDFDMLQEMQVTTGGADASQQTGGVGINLVTRSGTNRFKGNGAPAEHERPVRGRQRHRRDPRGRARARAPRSRTSTTTASKSAARSSATSCGSGAATASRTSRSASSASTRTHATCRPTDPRTGRTATSARIPALLDTPTSARLPRDRPDHAEQLQLEDYVVAVPQQPLQLPEHLGGEGAQRARRLRHAAARDRLPPEGRRQNLRAVRLGDRPGAGLEGQRPARLQRSIARRDPVAHIGNNFTLDFQDPEQRDIQPTFDITTGIWGRSFNESVFLRPTDSLDLTTSYFLPGHARRRPRVQVRLPLAHGHWRIDQPHRAATPCAPVHDDDDPARRPRRAATPTCSVTATPTTRPEHARGVHAGHLHGESPHAEPRRALGSTERRSACSRRACQPTVPAT